MHRIKFKRNKFFNKTSSFKVSNIKCDFCGCRNHYWKDCFYPKKMIGESGNHVAQSHSSASTIIWKAKLVLHLPFSKTKDKSYVEIIYHTN